MIKKYKQGAASFYIVVFSTLVLLVVMASFTALVVAQITRSSNEDLSQSAYDSALAGVEDAKLAYYNYRTCLAQGATAKQPAEGKTEYDCGEIIWLMDNAQIDGGAGDANCDVVAKVLGREVVDGSGVVIKESEDNNNMQQWSTCVKVQTNPKNYLGTVSNDNPLKVVDVKLDNVSAAQIKKIKVSWGVNIDEATSIFIEDDNISSFPKEYSGADLINPPVIGVALIQASNEFMASDFDVTEGDRTNRGLVYLVPRNGSGKNSLDETAMLKSNDKTAKNDPHAINCSDSGESEFACAAEIKLPKPVGGERSDDNFKIAISLVYGKATDFALEFFCDDGVKCGEDRIISETGEETKDTNQASTRNMQIAIDSTGRANDLFRRVETRLEQVDNSSISILGPLELFGEDSSSDTATTLKKDYTVTKEYNF